MSTPLAEEGLDTIFQRARTYRAWTGREVPDDLLHRLYDLMKWGPTSANCSPGRVIFVRSPQAKERLKPALSSGNIEQTMKAPVTAILANDLAFFEYLPRLHPSSPGIRDLFAKNSALAEVAAMRNGSLQGAYFIIAARALGLDCGPMSGFENAKVDAEFFAGTRVKSNFLCNLGYGDPSKLHPRGPRLSFEEACQLL
jgi:3-hydroxypropanoate dehydrogenase